MITALPGVTAWITDSSTNKTIGVPVQAWDMNGYALVYDPSDGKLVHPADLDVTKWSEEQV